MSATIVNSNLNENDLKKIYSFFPGMCIDIGMYPSPVDRHVDLFYIISLDFNGYKFVQKVYPYWSSAEYILNDLLKTWNIPNSGINEVYKTASIQREEFINQELQYINNDWASVMRKDRYFRGSKSINIGG